MLLEDSFWTSCTRAALLLGELGSWEIGRSCNLASFLALLSPDSGSSIDLFCGIGISSMQELKSIVLWGDLEGSGGVDFSSNSADSEVLLLTLRRSKLAESTSVALRISATTFFQ